jgi:hypothetical protein
MREDTGVVDLIEWAHDATRYCHCGAHTTPIWRDGVIWLECSTLAEPPDSRLRRLLGALVPHVHEEIIDLRGDGAQVAAP